MRAAIAPGSFNAEKRTVDVVWSTGARGARYDWDIGRYYEELSMDADHVNLDRMNAGASVLNSHQSYDLNSVIGAVVPGTATADGKEGRATVALSQRDDIAGIVGDIQAGIIKHISVGYNVARYEQVDIVMEGDSKVPVYRAVDWEPAEISFVPIPFDAGAQTRSREEAGTACVFVQRGAAATKGEAMTPEEIEAQRVAQEAEKQRAAQAAQAAREEGARAERQRTADIRTACAVLPDSIRAATETELVDGNKTVEEARAAVIEKLTAAQPSIRSGGQSVIETTEDERDKWRSGVEAHIIQRAGLVPMMRQHFGKEFKADPGEFRGLTLKELARDYLERRGVKVRGLSPMKMVEMAMRSDITQSTSDFVIALENVLNKTLLAGYATQADTWSRFVGTGSATDFRPLNMYRLGLFGKLDAINENGEYKRKAINDAEKETIQLATVGNIINLSRQAIVNDDMGIFSDLAAKLGRAARLSIEIDVYALLAENAGLGPVMGDGKTMFHADHGNIATTPAYPSVASFDAARQQMAVQKDPWGNEFLDLRPDVWLGPLDKGGAVRVLNGAQYDPDVTGKFQRPNIVNGMFSDVIDTPRLTGNPWYVFADKDVAPAIKVLFLDGQEAPVLESREGWNVDGVEWKVRLDYAVGAVDWRPALRNAGANPA
ncbi:prohead protease/major capsid protein fusion protein [Bradyrhizobium sp.]|uniref:prohead protease/major capsid protein fusion protein n=1 Tax=Bradyrhizobium sp. TaxID=376 RepID=UPI0039E613E7